MTALLAALAWSSGTRSGKAVLVLWNVLGVLDLILAVSMGLLALFTQSGPVTMAPMRLFPLSLVPAFGVPLAFILHFTGLALVSLKQKRGQSLPSSITGLKQKRGQTSPGTKEKRQE
jgi:hypothetical protein